MSIRRIAIIPARGGSKRLPRKNILDMAGKPMMAYPIAAARASGLFDDVIVSSEDAEVQEIAKAHGATVMSRDINLATDKSGVDEVCVDLLTRLKADNKFPDIFCVLYPTAVFITPEDLIAAEKKMAHANVVMGVTEFPIHPYKALSEEGEFLKPVFPVENNQKSQTYPHWVSGNGTFYWAQSAAYLKAPGFYPDKLVGHEIPYIRGVDIDTPSDYETAQLLMKAYLLNQGGTTC